MNGLGTRIGRGLNRMMGTRGRVLDGRYHAVPLRSGAQVRSVLQYLVENAERHARQGGAADRGGVPRRVHVPGQAALRAAPVVGAAGDGAAGRRRAADAPLAVPVAAGVTA